MISGKIICMECGLTKDIIIMTHKNSYNDPIKRGKLFCLCYKLIILMTVSTVSGKNNFKYYAYIQRNL